MEQDHSNKESEIEAIPAGTNDENLMTPESLGIDDIKGLINRDDLVKNIEINDDPYGGACVKVAINVMKYLDNFDGEFNIGYSPDMTTPHGIICACDDQGGITGYMASAARNIVVRCHKLGWKFYLAAVLNKYNIHDLREHEKFTENLCNGEVKFAEKEDVRKYIEGLRERYEARKAQ